MRFMISLGLVFFLGTPALSQTVPIPVETGPSGTVTINPTIGSTGSGPSLDGIGGGFSSSSGNSGSIDVTTGGTVSLGGGTTLSGGSNLQGTVSHGSSGQSVGGTITIPFE